MALFKRFSDALRTLFGATAPATPTAAERAAQLERKILRLVDELPPMPVTATRALALIENPDVPLADFAELVREDPALTTAILRVANSALFAGGAQTMRLEQAVVRLGLWTCRSLITAVGMRSVLRGESVVASACRDLWHHGFVAGSLCTQINRVSRLGFSGEEYAAGLLHDIGRVLIALADRDCMLLARVTDFDEDESPLARERAAIGADHCGLGAWFAELSSLPDPLVDVIRHHHEPERAVAAPRLVALVAAVDHMANHLQRGLEVGAYDAPASPALARLTAGWPSGRRDQLLAAVPDLMGEALTAAERDLS